MRLFDFIIKILLIIFISGCNNSNEDKILYSTISNNDQLDTSYCKCSYFSDSTKKIFISKRDSISNQLLRTNDTVLVFGFHEQFEKILFISNSRKVAFTLLLNPKAYTWPYYSDSLYLKQQLISKLWDSLLLSFDSLKTFNDLDNWTGDYDAVFTITLITKSEKKDYCICRNQLRSPSKNPISRLLNLFLEKVVVWIRT